MAAVVITTLLYISLEVVLSSAGKHNLKLKHQLKLNSSITLLIDYTTDRCHFGPVSEHGSIALKVHRATISIVNELFPHSLHTNRRQRQ